VRGDALKSNLRIEIADEKLAELDAAIREAATTQLPTLSAQASYTRLIPAPSGTQKAPVAADLSALQPLLDNNMLGTIDREQMLAPLKYMNVDYRMSGNIYNAALNLNHVLYSGGKIQNAKKISERARAASEWQRKSAVREIRRDVTKAYYNALAAGESVIALDSAISMMEVMIKDMKNAWRWVCAANTNCLLRRCSF